jgi:D-serine deaminase-like pyridoxal phosphate-dependent protein
MYIVQVAMLQRRIGCAPDELDTPCLTLELSLLEHNIERMASLARGAGVALRPHAKTHKLVEVAERQLAAGSDGLTVAKLGEAEVFAEHGIGNLLVAYPLWGEQKWRRLCALAEQAEVRVAADSAQVCEGISAAAQAHGVVVAVRIEVDTGYGRCGVQDASEAAALAAVVERLPGLRLAGVMSFAGQTYGAPDGVGNAARSDAERLVEVASALREGGFDTPEVSIGSTPSAAHIAKLKGITEFRPGTYVFSDRDQAALGWGTLDDCALRLTATVVSRPTRDRAVIDAGTKSLSSDRATHADGWGTIVGHPSWALSWLNEEHGVIALPPGEDPSIGTIVEIIPNHACGMLNLHDWVAVVRDGEVRDWWPVAARGRVS